MKKLISNYLKIIFPVLISVSCSQNLQQANWDIDDQEYLEIPGFNVLVFHDYYPIGDQGGIEFIQQGERIATNGFLGADIPAEGYKKLSAEYNGFRNGPANAKRVVNKDNNEIRADVSDETLDIDYSIRIWPENKSLHLVIDLASPLPEALNNRAYFAIQFYPVAYWGKTYHLGNKFGVFPQEALGPMTNSKDGRIEPVPLATGRTLMLAPEDPQVKMQVEDLNGDLALLDGRNNRLSGWFVVKSYLRAGVEKNALEWVITPNLIPGWQRKPMIGISQVGYHPDQVKQAVIELDDRAENIGNAVLQRIDNNGNYTDVVSAVPKEWGKFLRYKYAIFDFSSVKDPGLYQVSYGNVTSEPFSIRNDVYQENVWQPTLEIYFPVQMCHMRVLDRARIWHGACHLDDAVEAPVDCVHVDSYRSYETTETRFKPMQSIPGLNVGGWHDAGDNDLAAGSQASTVFYLVLAAEEFGIYVDQTTIDQENHYVELRAPDGVSDLKQQIEHGVLNLLSGYRVSGHSFAGIIATRIVRGYLGDQASFTDNLIYDPNLKPGETRGDRSGNPDDRWAFTSHDTGLEYEVMTALAAASRELRDYNNALAEECLQTAEKSWEFELTHDPVSHPSAYVPRNHEREEVLAACELLITTKNEKYGKRLTELLPVIKENTGEVGWSVTRTFDLVQDEHFKNAVKTALSSYKEDLDKELATNPFGVPWHPRIWGIGWNIQEYAVRQYYLHQALPDMFADRNVLNVVNYVMGCHPGSSTSFTSAIGAHSLIPAYGYNMHWWSYIPGGNASGTALIRPDFPELKEPFPYLWQQAEYVMPGASTYIFDVLAADKIMNK